MLSECSTNSTLSDAYLLETLLSALIVAPTPEFNSSVGDGGFQKPPLYDLVLKSFSIRKNNFFFMYTD